MSNDWKTDRAEAAIKEGTDKIMKAAQEKDKWKSLENQNLDTLLTSWNEESIPLPEEDLPYINEEEKPFETCLGIGLNQFFPEYITIDLTDEE